MSRAAAKKPHPPSSLSIRFNILKGEEVALSEGKIELLRQIGASGSLHQASQKLRISYMHAWNLVHTMNRCFAGPLVELSRGGPFGGGARLTTTGKRVLAIYRHMLRDAIQTVQPMWQDLKALLTRENRRGTHFSFALSSSEYNASEMSQSIRNKLPGKVLEISSNEVLSEVIVETEIGDIAAVITSRSVRELKLKIGDSVFALIKATNVSLEKESKTSLGSE